MRIHRPPILLQAAGKRHPELPNVPLVIDYAKTDIAKKLVQGVINNFGATARPYVATLGTPKSVSRFCAKRLSTP